MVQSKCLTLVALLALAGCAEIPPDEVQYADARFYVAAPPPPARIETVPPAPAPDWTWVPGHWKLENGQQVWETGHWLEPRPGEVYVQAYWSQQGGRWVYHPEHWRTLETPAQAQLSGFVGTTTTPPPLQIESVPPAPGPNYFWISGHWRWDANQYAWLPGRWEVSRPGWYWVPAHWVHDGPNWRYIAGSWQRAG